MPIYAECGGFMYLCRYLRDLEGRNFEMAGCFPFSTRMLPRLKSLGYREVHLVGRCPLGQTGQVIRGHEFHYSEIIEPDPAVETVYAVTTRVGERRTDEGYQIHNTLGSYMHLHFGSQPDSAGHFVEACRQFKDQRTVAP
jgi:cobyrinic acid a,c-diamide synthase